MRVAECEWQTVATWCPERKWREAHDEEDLEEDRRILEKANGEWLPQYYRWPHHKLPYNNDITFTQNIPTFEVDLWAAGCVLDIVVNGEAR